MCHMTLKNNVTLLEGVLTPIDRYMTLMDENLTLVGTAMTLKDIYAIRVPVNSLRVVFYLLGSVI